MRDIDPQNDLTFLRIRSKKNEIMVAPGRREQGGSRNLGIQQDCFLLGLTLSLEGVCLLFVFTLDNPFFPRSCSTFWRVESFIIELSFLCQV